MKVVGIVGAAMLMAAGIGGAHAQTAACADLQKMFGYSHAQVRALQGGVIEQDNQEITYTSKAGVSGFTDCKLYVAKEMDTISDYWDHHLWCKGASANSDAANVVVEGMWGCLKGGFTERAATEALLGGQYRIIEFTGEVPTAGVAAGLVDFGNMDYASVVLEKSYDTAKDYDLHLYWSFTE